MLQDFQSVPDHFQTLCIIQGRRSGVFNVNFEHISQLFLVFLLSNEKAIYNSFPNFSLDNLIICLKLYLFYLNLITGLNVANFLQQYYILENLWEILLPEYQVSLKQPERLTL